MVEGGGGGPEVSRAPETETRSSAGVVEAHIALATVDGALLNPDIRTSTDAQITELAKNVPEDLDPLIASANKLSTKSRKETYEGDTRSFDEQNKEWNVSFQTSITELIGEDISDDLKATRIKALEAVGINPDIAVLDENGMSKQVEEFREKFLGSESNIGGFIDALADGCESSQGVVDINKLTQQLTAIEPLLVVFGKNYDVNLLVKDFALARGKLWQDEGKRAAYAEEVKASLQTATTEETPQRLRHLWDIHKDTLSTTDQESASKPLVPEPPPVEQSTQEQPQGDVGSTEQSESADSETLIIDDRSKKAWELLKQEFPELNDVDIMNLPQDQEDNPATGGIYLHPRTEGVRPRLAIRKDNEPIIAVMRRDGQVILDYLANKLGISPEALTDDIIPTFILVHEAGHAHDYKGMTWAEVSQKQAESKQSLPAKNLADFKAKNPQATQAEVDRFMLDYRQTPTEKFADDFAFTFFQNHPELLVPDFQQTTDTASQGENDLSPLIEQVMANNKRYDIISDGTVFPHAYKDEDGNLLLGNDAEQVMLDAIPVSADQSTSQNLQVPEEQRKQQLDTRQAEASNILGRKLNEYEEDILAKNLTSDELVQIVDAKLRTDAQNLINNMLANERHPLVLSDTRDMDVVLSYLETTPEVSFDNMDKAKLLQAYKAALRKSEELNAGTSIVISLDTIDQNRLQPNLDINVFNYPINADGPEQRSIRKQIREERDSILNS